MVVIFWSIDIAMDIFRSDALCRRHNQYEQKIEIIGLDGALTITMCGTKKLSYRTVYFLSNLFLIFLFWLNFEVF